MEEVLTAAEDRSELTDKQFLGLAFAAIMAGGKSWCKLPTLLERNTQKANLLKGLQGVLEESGLGSDAAQWLTTNCHLVLEQTFTLIKHMTEAG